MTEEETREVCQKRLGSKSRSLGNFSNVSAHIFMFICYSPAGRSVLGETVLEVLSTTRGRSPRAVLRPRVQFQFSQYGPT